MGDRNNNLLYTKPLKTCPVISEKRRLVKNTGIRLKGSRVWTDTYLWYFAFKITAPRTTWSGEPVPNMMSRRIQTDFIKLVKLSLSFITWLNYCVQRKTLINQSMESWQLDFISKMKSKTNMSCSNCFEGIYLNMRINACMKGNCIRS